MTQEFHKGVVKVLMVISGTNDQASLAFKQEATRLQAELSEILRSRSTADLSSTEIQLTVLDQPGREQLTQVLEQGQYQILHYFGIGNLGPSGEELYLVNGKTNLTETLSGDEVGGLLVNNGIQMAVFISGRDAYTATFQPTADTGFSNLTQSLVKRGIKSVLAMAEYIPDEVALTLTRLFYRNLAQGYPVDRSLSLVRQELISAYGFDLYWSLPILGTEAEDAELDLLGEEEWDEEVDDIDYDDPEYEEDSALVSDLFSQLANPAPAASPIIPAPTLDQLPEVAKDKTTNPSEAKSRSDIRKQAFTKVWPLLGAVGVTAIALVSLWWFQNRQLQPITNLPSIPPAPSVPNSTTVNLKTASTSDLRAIAIEQFNKGNLSSGQRMVEELLNRRALPSASAALAAVSELQANHPNITFLRGRLAWQSVQVGDKNYSLDDACRYWETAVKHKPDPVYHNALGFAYYAEGDLNRANQAWFEALYLVEEQQAATRKADFTTHSPTPSVANQEALNAYAGLALVLSKSAQNQPTETRAKLLSEAIKLRQKVLTNDPVNFQPQTLSKNWLWTEKAIQDWRTILNSDL